MIQIFMTENGTVHQKDEPQAGAWIALTDPTATEILENSNDYDLCLRRYNVNGDPCTSPINTHLNPRVGIVGGKNVSKNANDPDAATYQGYIDTLMQTTDDEQRKELIADIQEELINHVWWVPLAANSVYAVRSSSLQGYVNIANNDWFRYCYFE